MEVNTIKIEIRKHHVTPGLNVLDLVIDVDGEKIVKFLTEIMIELGLKLNPQKTSVTNQVISASIKSDKLYWIKQKQRERDFEKHLLIIHELSKEFPGSGSLGVALNQFHKRIINIKFKLP